MAKATKRIDRPPKEFTIEILVLNERSASGLALCLNPDYKVPGAREVMTIPALVEAFNGASRDVVTESIRARPGDTVKWKCRTQEFTLRFSEGSPFVSGAATLVSRDKRTKPEKVRELEEGDPRRYYYAITVVIGHRVITLDPEVIIDENAP